MSERLSRFGARLGNWNDRHFAGDTRFDRRWPWHWLDRIASWLYTMPDRRGGV